MICGLYVISAMSYQVIGSESDWINAVNACEIQDYHSAEHFFNQAIDDLEVQGDTEHASVYVDRARLYSMQGRHKESLKDLDIAIAQGSLEGSDILRCSVTRILANCNLGNQDAAMIEMRNYKNIYVNAPILQITETEVIIRNLPECECYRSLAKDLFISIGMVDSESDISFLKSGIMVAKRSLKKTDCNCGCDNQKPVKKWQIVQQPEDCRNWCERCSVVAACWCGKTFREWRCQAACLLATQLIKEVCNTCCDGAGFWENCVKPFEDVAWKMGIIEPELYCAWN